MSATSSDIPPGGRRPLLAAYSGRSLTGTILDKDAHEAAPTDIWEEIFGADVQYLADAMYEAGKRTAKTNYDSTHVRGVTRLRDGIQINSETIWKSKFELAPGPWDFDRHIKVMDLTSTQRQIIYPGSRALR